MKDKHPNKPKRCYFCNKLLKRNEYKKFLQTGLITCKKCDNWLTKNILEAN